jgi:phage shock protein PspC (stress-responsive transcriptional regulator)
MPNTFNTEAAGHEPPISPLPPNRFFEWMRAVDVPRRPGWLGGVCAGVADRLGVDVVVVRGIVVVIAVLGGPVFLIYAAAWLLLPDLHDRIHLERLLSGVFDRAIVGIVGVFLLGLLPVTQGIWAVGSSYWGGGGDVLSAIGRTLWTLLVIAVGIWFVVWFARRTERATITTRPATTDDQPDTIRDVTDDVTASADSTAHPSAVAPASPPLEPPPGTPAEDVAAWRVQHAEWRTEIDAWKRQQSATARELRQRRAEEARSRAAAAAVANAHRRRERRLANPRIGAPWVTITLGLAILLGAVGGLSSSTNPDWAGYESVVGLGVAALTLALSSILAGALRRRSGFLGFLVAVLVVGTVVAAALPRDPQLLYGGSGYGAGPSALRYAPPSGEWPIVVDDPSLIPPDSSDGGSN